MSVWTGLGSLLLGIIVAGAAIPETWAESYPAKPVKIVSPSGPGGPNDFVARILADKLTSMWGQRVVVDNKPGAAQILAYEAAANAAPDGHTFVLAAQGFAVNPALIPDKLTYNTSKDFDPISVIVEFPAVLISAKGLPVGNVQDVIKLARQKPGDLKMAGNGPGVSSHLAAVLLQQLTGTEFLMVHYRTGPHATTAVTAGEVDLYFDAPSTALPQVRSGNVKGLAVSSAVRSPIASDIPTFTESGVPGFVMTFWYALLAPSGLPSDIRAKVERDVMAAVAAPEVQQRLLGAMMEPRGTNSREAAAFIQRDMVRWAKVIKDGNIKVE